MNHLRDEPERGGDYKAWLSRGPEEVVEGMLAWGVNAVLRAQQIGSPITATEFTITNSGVMMLGTDLKVHLWGPSSTVVNGENVPLEVALQEYEERVCDALTGNELPFNWGTWAHKRLIVSERQVVTMTLHAIFRRTKCTETHKVGLWLDRPLLAGGAVRQRFYIDFHRNRSKVYYYDPESTCDIWLTDHGHNPKDKAPTEWLPVYQDAFVSDVPICELTLQEWLALATRPLTTKDILGIEPPTFGGGQP